MGRIDKENYYLDIAQTVAGRSTCLRRCYGAILVKSDEIISTGYNGAPRGRRNCVDLSYCTREALNIPSGERYELCRSVHAEANAIISAARSETLGATLYMACVDPGTGALIPGSTSCSMCRRLIIITWGKFHLLIFSFLLFLSFLKKLVNIYFPLSASYDKGHLRRNCEKNVVIL